MNSATPTLKAIFAFSELAPDSLAAIESNQKMPSLRAAITTKAPAISWPAALDEVVKSTEGLLDVGMPEIAAAAWNKYRILRKYADTKKYPPNETLLVPLAKHTIKSAYEPYIEILIGEEIVGSIGFDINLELTLEGVLLKIRDGKIVEIRIGACQGKCTVRCENFVILEKESRSFPLPGSIPLGAGIPVAA